MKIDLDNWLAGFEKVILKLMKSYFFVSQDTVPFFCTI